MPTVYNRREERAIRYLNGMLGVTLKMHIELEVSETEKYEFDGVSADEKIVVEVRANDMPRKGKLRDTQLAETSEACLFMLGVKDAERRILALTQQNFFQALMATRQTSVYRSLGIEVVPAFD